MARSADPARTSAVDLVIRGVAVVNPRDGSLQVNQDVHIAGERILSVVPCTGESPPPPVRVVEAAGQYLVPGFADMHAHPADFIKAALVTSEVFYAAQAEARRLGIPILGHLPSGIDVARVSGDGMRSIEHLGPGTGLLACCSAEREAVDREVAALPAPSMSRFSFPIPEPVFERIIRKIVINPVNRSQQADVDILAHVSATFAQDAAAALAERLVRDGTWQVPTLIRSRTMHLCDDPAFRDDPDLRYVSRSTLRGWAKAADKFARFPAGAGKPSGRSTPCCCP